MENAAAIFILLLYLQAPVKSLQSTCPTVGSSRKELGALPGGINRLLVDLSRPAQCSGTVTGWSYCAHLPANTNNRLLSAVFVVLQRRSVLSTVYEAISASVTPVNISLDDNPSSQERGFVCRNISLSADSYFSIPENAIVGACIPSGGRGLIISSTVSGSVPPDIRRVDLPIYNDCLFSVVSGARVDVLAGLNSVATILHLEAQISPSRGPDVCTAGSNPAGTSPSTANGIFLDVLNLAPCSGPLLAWNYCFYPRNGISNAMYSITVGVWTLNESSTQYQLLESTLTTISVTLPAQNSNQVPLLECRRETIATSVEIAQGSVIGVIANITTLSRLPVVGMATSGVGSDHYVFKLETSENVHNVMLHLYAEIQSSGVGTTTLGSVGGSAMRSVGVAVAISAVVVLLVVLVAAVITVLLCVSWRSRRSSSMATPSLKTYDSKLPKNEVDSSVKDNSHYAGSGPSEPPETTTKPPASKAAPPPRPALPTRLMKPKHPPPRPVHKTTSAPIQSDYRPPPFSSSLRASTLSRSPEYAELSKIYPDGKEDTKYAMLLQRNIDEDVYGNVPHYMLPATDRSSLYSQLKTLKTKTIQLNQIRETGHLGSGQFGNVEKGEWRNGSKKLPVALKTLNKGTSQENIVKFLQEAAIMAQFNHPNVIHLYGVVAEKEPILVVEFADGGDLKQHLEGLRSSVEDDVMLELSQLLLRFSQQIAFGMQYLSKKGFIHRDLAARNILVFGTKICKIADFGMSRDLPVDGIYVSSGGVIPLKWTALEAIHYKEFSTASDVWSYGCVLYEIWSLGHKPFEFEEIGQKVIRLLRSGVRLPPPPGCPRAIYTIMIRAWHHEPDERPSFRQIVVDLVDSRGEKNTLYIPEEDLDSHTDAGRLGAELQAGANMYRDLQDTYR